MQKDKQSRDGRSSRLAAVVGFVSGSIKSIIQKYVVKEPVTTTGHLGNPDLSPGLPTGYLIARDENPLTTTDGYLAAYEANLMDPDGR